MSREGKSVNIPKGPGSNPNLAEKNTSGLARRKICRDSEQACKRPADPGTRAPSFL